MKLGGLIVCSKLLQKGAEKRNRFSKLFRKKVEWWKSIIWQSQNKFVLKSFEFDETFTISIKYFFIKVVHDCTYE